MSKHTPEPWVSNEYNAIDSPSGRVMRAGMGWLSDYDKDRAVSCVNALAGISDPAAFVADVMRFFDQQRTSEEMFVLAKAIRTHLGAKA